MKQEDRGTNRGLIIGVAGLILFIGVVIGSFFFTHAPSTFLIKDATIAQVELITQADPDSRVWYDSANLLAQGSSLLEVTLRTRPLEKDRATEFLDSIRVQYYGIK